MTGENVSRSPKTFRRKKRWQGAIWTPKSISSTSEDGAWCPVHRMRHGYKTMSLIYGERRGDGKFKLLWCCPQTGNVLEEM